MSKETPLSDIAIVKSKSEVIVSSHLSALFKFNHSERGIRAKITKTLR